MKVKPMGVPPSLSKSNPWPIIGRGLFNSLSFNVADMQAVLHSGMDSMEAFYENSKPFFKFLEGQGLDELLRKTRLRLRKKHAIVPHVRGSCLCSLLRRY